MRPAICYHGGVENGISRMRLTETAAGRLAAFLLVVVWISSMSMADANAYSCLPMLGGAVLIVLLALSSLIRGAKAVRLTWVSWLSLGIGLYYLVRCLCSFDVVSSWREASAILVCIVYYVAGVYAAQGRRLRPVLSALALALVFNMLFFYLVHETAMPIEWTGRPSVGPGGVNSRPVSLFVYKNEAGAFFVLAGMLAAAAALWNRSATARCRLLLLALGIGGVLLSAQCGTRAGYLIAPAMAVGIFVLSLVLRLYAKEKYGAGVFIAAFLVLLGLGLAVVQLLFEPGGLSLFTDADSHQRFRIWAACCSLLPNAPLTGYGASSVPWLLAPFLRLYSCWSLANYAHNEYLQVWVDYGLIGLVGMLVVVVAHAWYGFGALCSELVSPVRRILTALALLCLLSWFIAGSTDFFWHQPAVGGMMAFSCGVLASPYPYRDERRGRNVRVSPENAGGKAVLALLGTGGIAMAAWLMCAFYPVWQAQWEYNELCRGGRDEDGETRLALLTRLLPDYPSSRLMDSAYSLPTSGRIWEEEEACLRTVLAANPRQLFMTVQLGRLLTEQGRYQEAEALYRRSYLGDGMEKSRITYWPNFYIYNLLLWGHSCMLHGDMPGAYSRLAYALRVADAMKINLAEKVAYRHDAWQADETMKEGWPQYLLDRRQDAALLELLGTQPDDAWMQPLEPGGKPALYRRYGAADPAERETVAAEERKAGRKA